MTDILTRNNVHVSGSGTQPVVFVHGFGCDQNMWRYITPAFEKDYKIVLFDYVGAGKSDSEAYHFDRYGTLNGYADDILEVCEALQLQDIILAAHSVSAMSGMLAVLHRPELFSRLIMVCPSPCYINDPADQYVGGFEKHELLELLDLMEKNYIGWANFLAPVIMKNEDRSELTEELLESFCATDPVIARHFAAVTFLSDNRAQLPNLRIPTLIIQCNDDVIAPMEVGVYMHEKIPDNQLAVIDAIGHCPHMSHPEETIKCMVAFLAAE